MRRIIEDALVAVDGSFDQPQRWHPLYHDHVSARDGLSQVLAAEACCSAEPPTRLLRKPGRSEATLGPPD
jgi:hypothetical protein